jgi:hypothetical protein
MYDRGIWPLIVFGLGGISAYQLLYTYLNRAAIPGWITNEWIWGGTLILSMLLARWTLRSSVKVLGSDGKPIGRIRFGTPGCMIFPVIAIGTMIWVMYYAFMHRATTHGWMNIEMGGALMILVSIAAGIFIMFWLG